MDNAYIVHERALGRMRKPTRRRVSSISSASTIARFVAFLLIAICAPAANAASQGTTALYDDALRRFERNDFSGASIQLKNALQKDGDMLAAHVLLGRTLLRKGDFRAAELAFEQAEKRGLDRGQIAVALAQTYLGLGRPDLVVERVAPSAAPADAKVDVLSLIGTAYAQLGQRDMAQRAFDEAKRIAPNSATPLIAEISTLLNAGLPDRAIVLGKRAVSVAPGNAEAWNTYAAVLHARSDLRAALDAYTRALAIEPKHIDARVARAAALVDLKRVADAEDDLRFLKDYAPGEPRAAYMRALVASRAGNEQATAAALEEVVKLIDALSPAWLAQREQLLMLGALANNGLRRFEKALGYATQLARRYERNTGAKKLLASIYLSLRDHSSALTHLESLQKLAPADPEVLSMLGAAYLASADYARAANYLEKAVAVRKSPDAERLLGISQLRLGQAELGAATLEKAVAADATDIEAASMLCQLYIARGQPQKAVRLAAEIAKRQPTSAAALSFLADVKKAVGDTAGAHAIYTQIASTHGEFVPARLNLARFDMAQGKLADARRRMVELGERSADSSDVLLQLAAIEEADGKTAQALRHLRRATELHARDPLPAIALLEFHLRHYQPGQALSAANQLAPRYPHDIHFQLARASVSIALGELSGARDILLRAVVSAGADPDLHVRIARSMLAIGEPRGAYDSVQKSLRARPDDLDAMSLTVEIERQRAGPEAARSALARLTQKHPNSAKTAAAKGDLAIALKQPAAAVDSYKLAWSREQTTERALNVARAYLLSGDTTSATAFLEKWAANKPSDHRAIAALAEMLFRSGQLAAAREAYGRALQLTPNAPALLNNFANLLHRLHDPQARSHAEKAVSITPDNPHYADTLGWILVQQGDVANGLRFLDHARLRRPDNAEIRFHLAAALTKASRLAEARTELTAALAAVPPLDNKPELLALKKQLGM